jgi:hypothetical protein
MYNQNMNMYEQFPGKNPLSVGQKGGSGENLEAFKQMIIAQREEQEKKKKQKKGKKKNSPK